MKKLILVLLLALLAAPALAGIKSCNTVMVNQTLCGDLTEDLLYVRLPGDSRAVVTAALAKSVGWKANIPCTEPMIALGQCALEQLGQNVPNPETRPQAASRAVSKFIASVVVSDTAEGHRTLKKEELEALLAAIQAPVILE